MRRLLSSAVLFTFLGSLAPVLPSAAAGAPRSLTAKVPLDYRAYDSWNLLRGTKLSDDGNWIAYTLLPEDGDPTLVVRNLNTGAEFKEERGTTPAFTPDSKWVVYTIRAPNDEIHKAEREHKKPDEQPKNGLGVLELASGRVTKHDRVKSVKLPRDAGHTTIAILMEPPAPSPRPSGAPPATTTSLRAELVPTPAAGQVSTAQPATSAPPSSAPSLSASPDELHKVEPGTQLYIRELDSTAGLDVKDVNDVAVSHDGNYVAYAVSGKDDKCRTAATSRVFRCGLHILERGSEENYDIFIGHAHYKNLTFAPKHALLAFLSDHASFSEKAPHYILYQSDLGIFPTKPEPTRHSLLQPLAAPTTAGMPRGWAASVNGTVAYSRDGKRLFFGSAPAPTPVPSGTPEPLKVDIWNWRDGDLQTYQKLNADKERKRTYLALVHVPEAVPGVVAQTSVVQLASPSMRNLAANENPAFALGSNDLAYRKLISWEGEQYADLYAIALRDGSRRLLQRKIPANSDFSFAAPKLSPDGRFVVNYDRIKRDWYAIDTQSAKRSELTDKLPVAFYDSEDDHPAPPGPYQFGGWVDGGKYALLLDRFDIWAADVASGKVWILTQGQGRKSHVRFFPIEQYGEDRD